MGTKILTRRLTAIATLPALLLTFSAIVPVRAADTFNVAQTLLPNQGSKPGKSCSIRAKHGCQNKDRSPAKTEPLLTIPSVTPASPQPTLTCRHPNPNAPIKCNKS